MMTATDLDGYADDYEFPDLYGAYREHLDRCPRIHLGVHEGHRPVRRCSVDRLGRRS
ncbi:hypothetical protein [Streptomyces spectabilis]|uniref:hypothetical protein n=1 Tax=Streptomyces spectabilis TaxID=68270 RepID=UPI0033E7EDF4